MMKRSPWFFVVLLGALLLLFTFLYLIRSVAIPFLLALLLAYFLDPAADFLERRNVPRTLAVGVVFLGFALMVSTGAAFLLPAVEKELLQIQKSLPRYAESLYRLVPDPVLEWFGIQADQDMQSLLSQALDGIRKVSFDVVKQLAVFLSRAFSSTFGFILAVLGYFIIPIYLFYLLRDFDRIKTGFLKLVPLRHQDAVVSVGNDIDRVLGGFIRGQLTVCFILGVMYSCGLVVIGIDLALLIGILSGAAFIVPYLGTLLGVLAAGSMAVAKFQDLIHPALVVGWFALVQGLEGTVITPKIVGDRVGLHPLLTILAVLIGGELFGFLGLLLAVPVTASGKVVLVRLVDRYRQTEFFLRNDGDGDASH